MEENEVPVPVPDDENRDDPVVPEKEKGVKDHQRYRGAAEDHEEIPEGHSWTHLPAHPKCPACRDVKLKKTGSLKKKVENIEIMLQRLDEMIKHGLELVHMDTLQMRRKDVFGNRYYLVTVDHFSKYPRGVALEHKTAVETWSRFAKLYPGSRFERVIRFPLQGSLG